MGAREDYSHKLDFFHRLSQQKVNVIMTLMCQGSFHINSSNITGHQRTMTIYEIHKTLFI